jgi:hypothetical protein
MEGHPASETQEASGWDPRNVSEKQPKALGETEAPTMLESHAVCVWDL